MNCKNNVEVQELVNGMEREVFQLKEELLRIIWFMRGSVSYQEVVNMSGKEREIINKIIKDNLETTKKSRLPFF